MSEGPTFLWLPSCHTRMMSQVGRTQTHPLNHPNTVYIHFTAFAWLNDTSMLSCSKDGKLIYEGLQDTIKPADKAVSYSVYTSALDHFACGGVHCSCSTIPLTESVTLLLLKLLIRSSFNLLWEYNLSVWRLYVFSFEGAGLNPNFR